MERLFDVMEAFINMKKLLVNMPCRGTAVTECQEGITGCMKGGGKLSEINTGAMLS